MSVLGVLVAFAVLVISQAHPISHECKERLFTYHKDCLAKTGVDEKIVEQIHDGQFSDEPKLKEYFLCLSQKMGTLNEAGEVQLEVVKKKLGKYITDTEKLNKVVEQCAVQKDTSLNTAFDLFKCCRNSLTHVDLAFYVIPVTEEKRQKIKKYCQECMEETMIEMKIIEAARKGEFSDDPILKKYFLCMSKKFGFQNSDGTIQTDVIKNKLTDALQDNSKAERLADKCISEKETPEETAFSILKCLLRKTHVNFIENGPTNVDNATNLPPEKVEKLVAYHKDCLSQTAVDMDLVDATRKGNFPEDLKLKEYFFCLSKKAEFQDEIGDINKDILRQKLNEIIKDPAMSQQLIDKCAVKRDTPQNTAFSTVKCYYENTPSHINIFQVITLNEEQKQKLTRYNTECQNESGISQEAMEGLKKGQFSNDEKFKNHLFCFYRKLGLQNDAGEIQRAVLLEKFGRLLRNATLSEKLFKKCAIQKDSAQDTSFEAFVCYYENSPSHVNIFALF